MRRSSPCRCERGRELVEPRRELQVDVQADARRLVREERERLVERRQLGRDLAELLEGARPDGAGGDAVAHLVEVIGVRDDERPARQVEDVELDEVDAELDGGAERAQRVLGLDERRAAMADPEDASVPALELDHAALLRARAEPPPRERSEQERLPHGESGCRSWRRPPRTARGRSGSACPSWRNATNPLRRRPRGSA